MSRIICCCITLVLLFAGPASAQWETRYQQDPLETFNAVTFPSGTVGYAVGSTIYKTTDGGFTWVDQGNPTASALGDVFFKSETEGWAVGANGVIVYTTDGGATWNVHSQSGLLSSRPFNAIHFQGSTGWLGGYWIHTGNRGALYRTTDNGVNWTIVADSLAQEVNGIDFFSPLVGVVALDRSMIYTTDGGTTWNNAVVNLGPYPYTRGDIEAVKVISGNVAVATGWGSMVGGQPTIIIVTTDAGQTWNIANTDYHWATYGYGYCITAFDNNEILISGGGAGSAAYVLSSTDLGATWTSRKAVTGDYAYGIAAVPGTNRAIAVGRYGLIALSPDRGASWDYVTSPTFGFNGFQKLISRGATVYGIGDLSAFAKITPDGTGYNVKFQTIAPDNFGAILYDIEIVPTSGGHGVGEGYVMYACGAYQSLYRSNDGGKTWIPLNHTFGVTDRFRAMHWFDVDNGILVGTRGSRDAISVTDDGGQTLTEVWYNVTYRDLNDISFAPENPLIGVIGGNYGPQTSPFYISLHYTTDGGNTWSLASTDITPTNGNILSVQMLSETTGWAVGSSGIVAKTTDGGATWTQQPSFTSNQLNCVEFNHPKLGWVAGAANTCFRTGDGGVNWTDIAPAVPPAATPTAQAVHFQGSQGVLWYAGRDFFLLSSTDAALTDAGTPISLPFALNQNFPNPFNPSTTIKFNLHRDGLVRLNVYDVAGRLVAKVLEKEMKAGDHSIGFNASGLASGVYFYRLSSADQEQTRKMILLR